MVLYYVSPVRVWVGGVGVSILDIVAAGEGGACLIYIFYFIFIYFIFHLLVFSESSAVGGLHVFLWEGGKRGMVFIFVFGRLGR